MQGETQEMASQVPKLVKLNTGQRLLEFSGTGFAFGPQVLGIYDTEDKCVQFWSMQDLFDAKQPKCTSYRLRYRPWYLAFPQATPTVAIMEKNKEKYDDHIVAIHLLNWEKGKETKKARPQGKFWQVQFSDSGDSLVAGGTPRNSRSAKLELWSAPKWKRVNELQLQEDFIQMMYGGHGKTAVIFSPQAHQGHKILALHFLNVSTGAFAHTIWFDYESTADRYFVMSDDQKNIVAYAPKHEFTIDYLAVYRVGDQKCLWSKQIPIHRCAISPNNQHLMTYDDNNMLRFWDITTGRESPSPIKLSSAQRMGGDEEYWNHLMYDHSGRFLGLHDSVSGTISIIELGRQTPKPSKAKKEIKQRREPVTTSKQVHQPKVQIQPSHGKPVKRVLGVLKSFQSITMTDLMNYSGLSVEESRNLVFELIADDLVAGRFDSESDSFVSATAASASKQIRSDRTILARCMFCGKALGRALRAGDEVPCPSCGMINVG